uniref:Anoctamin n=1 Tax=Poecilia latipinna TaxID=48699 RepID=A0A3B3U1S2_9TELE
SQLNCPLLLSPLFGFTPLSYDYVLVAKLMDDRERHAKKQREYIEQLRIKNFKVTKIIYDNLVFYGIQAPKEIFQKYRYLLKISDACSGTSTDSNISLKNLRDLMKSKVFETRFCLHEVKFQLYIFFVSPLTCVFLLVCTVCVFFRDYFGEKVALYFLWLGWYTFLLILPAVIGILVFLYGLSYFNSSPLVQEVCESDTVMCPLCDSVCKVWKLSDTCSYAKLSLLFDNNGTVFFAMFMAIWTTLFMEFWKRHLASFVCEWRVTDWSESEEELILELVNDAECRPKMYKHSYLRTALVLICVLVMILVIIGLTHFLVVVRVLVAGNLAKGFKSNLGAMLAGAVLHFLIITIMTKVNRIVALKLCKIEETRTFADTEKSFTVKMFTFQFFTYFSSLFYVAFFLGRINGHPGEYVRLAGQWRLEECHPSGCLTDLFIQMAIIMVLKQIISNVFEYFGPLFKKFLRKKKRQHKLQRKCATCYLKDDYQLKEGQELCESCKLRDWHTNYELTDVDSFSLFNEFLEMVIQFSFTTIFVAAFPLAPLFAFLNNVIEIRLDAIKMVTLERRMVPKKTNTIGVWIDILEAVGVLAVIVNGLVIGVSSDFIPRLVYRYVYGPCVNGTAGVCMSGYINNTLSVASMADSRVKFDQSQMITDGIYATSCSYKDYRDTDFNITHQFWLILAVRFAFVILFEHVLVICKFIASWFIPPVPMHVKNDGLTDKFRRLQEELK